MSTTSCRTKLDGPDVDWNVVTLCRHHHLLLTGAQRGCRGEAWWNAGEAALALGKCFARGLTQRSHTETDMPEHVQDAISAAFSMMISPLPDRYYEDDCEWTLADIHIAFGAPLMSAGAAHLVHRFGTPRAALERRRAARLALLRDPRAVVLAGLCVAPSSKTTSPRFSFSRSASTLGRGLSTSLTVLPRFTWRSR
jgi:hypothetical protein